MQKDADAKLQLYLEHVKLMEAVVLIQSFARRFLARVRFHRLKESNCRVVAEAERQRNRKLGRLSDAEPAVQRLMRAPSGESARQLFEQIDVAGRQAIDECYCTQLYERLGLSTDAIGASRCVKSLLRAAAIEIDRMASNRPTAATSLHTGLVTWPVFHLFALKLVAM